MRDHVSLAEFRSTMRTIAWERAKGGLRELLAIVGSTHSETVQDTTESLDRYGKLQVVIDEFIEKIEDEGFHE